MNERYEKEHIKYVYEVREIIDYKSRPIDAFENLIDAKHCQQKWIKYNQLNKKDVQITIEYKKKEAVVLLSRYDHCPSVELPLDDKYIRDENGFVSSLNGFEWNVYVNIGVNNFEKPYGRRLLVGHRSYEDAVKHINEYGYEVRNPNTSEALMESTMLHCLEYKDELDKLGLDQQKYYNKSYDSHK